MRATVDPEFARYARARQHRFLAAAWMVDRDLATAEGAVEATLAALAGRWRRAHADPEDLARRLLRTALLTSERSVEVDRRTRHESVDHVVQLLADRDRVEEVDRAGEALREVDLVDRAWQRAVTARRQRRLRLAGAALAVVVVAGLWWAVSGGRTAVRPRPGPSAVPTTLADGTRFAQLPLEGREAVLRYFAAGLPPALDLAASPSSLSSLSGGSPGSRVVVAWLRPAGADAYRLVVAGADGRAVAPRGLTVRAGPGGPDAVLGPRAIDAAGRRVVLAEPGDVLVLDARTGESRRYPVPSAASGSSAGLRDAGWTAQGRVVVRDDSGVWTVDPGQAGAMPSRAAPTSADTAAYRLEVVDGRLRITGPGSAAVAVRAPVTQVVGPTVSAGSSAAALAVFDQNLTQPMIVGNNGPITQGLVAADLTPGAAARVRVLLAPESPDGQTGRVNPCCRVLAWADPRTVLLETAGRHGRWVLAWDVVSGQVYAVTRLRVATADEPVSPLAVGVGIRD